MVFWRCPERWRRRYLEGESERWSGPMLAGSAAWHAEARSFHQQLEHGQRAPTEAVLDWMSDEWVEMSEREEPLWNGDKPGELKDRTAAAVRLWHTVVAPTIRPLAVERRLELRIDDLPWLLTGYIDVEHLPGRRRSRGSVPLDYKMTGSRLSQQEADANPQASLYLTGRRAEGDPASRFEFGLALRQVAPKVDTVITTRTDAQLDAFLGRVVLAAARIAHSIEYDNWDGAVPGEWWCSERYCGFWDSCSFGGLHANDQSHGGNL